MNQLAGAPMSDHGSVLHSTFRIERSYPQHPPRVFHAFADKEMVRRWRVEVELVPSGGGTHLTYTEHGAFFDGVDSVKGREEGCRALWGKLDAELRR
jgi:uncharacterized protein YndB with AHSA1/START domain